MSVGIEFGTALTFPADEAAVYGILDSTGELFGFLLVTLGGAMSHVHLEVSFCAILASLVGLAFVMFFIGFNALLAFVDLAWVPGTEIKIMCEQHVPVGSGPLKDFPIRGAWRTDFCPMDAIVAFLL